MIQITRINSLEADQLQPYRTLRRAVEHVKKEIFVAEGEKVVRRMLATEIKVVSMLLTEAWFEEMKPLLEKSLNGEEKIWVAPKKLLETIVGFPLHQGIMAVGKIPKPLELSEVISRSRGPHLLVALDGLTNADNVGVIVRSCAAFNVDALIISRNSTNPYLRKSVRMSMGAVFQLPIVSVTNLVESFERLTSDYGIRIIAAQPEGKVRPIDAVDLLSSICLVFGSEGDGISSEVLAKCSERVRIPIGSRIDSLNVATAAAIFLFEVQRQRRQQHSPSTPR